MKKIKLLKDLETPDGKFSAGEIVDVSDEHYDWLMAQYMSDRAKQVAEMQEGEKKLKKWGVE